MSLFIYFITWRKYNSTFSILNNELLITTHFPNVKETFQLKTDISIHS